MKTLGERVSDTAGRSTGFDYMRILLAMAVLLWHSFPTAYGNEYARAFLATPWRPPVAVIVPMFFALSGWLVAGSLLRNSLFTFVALRVIRIVPALGVETLLSALVLGPLLTALPLHAYFTHPMFLTYLGNIVGWIHIRLPGVFLSNPVSNVVNGQLWTVPWELWCYVALTGAALFRVVKFRLLFLGLTIVGTGVLFFTAVLLHGRINQENGVAPQALLLAFLSAVSLYLYRDRTPWSAPVAFASAVLATVLLWIPGGDYLIGFPVAYVTIYLGLLNPSKIALLRGADYSYGLYIYHYAIQQAIVFLFPAYRHWYFVFPVSFILCTVFAAFSWTLVEKPALGARKHLPMMERLLAGLGLGRSLALDTPRS